MNEMKVFTSSEFGTVRTVTIEGEPWFVGKDVAEILGYGNTRDAILSHVDDEDRRVIQKSENATFEIPNRGMSLVNESGLYSLILGSKLSSAKRFKHWVTSEVLPSIRKHSAYLTPEKVEEFLLNPDTIIRLATERQESRRKQKSGSRLQRWRLPRPWKKRKKTSMWLKWREHSAKKDLLSARIGCFPS